VSSNFTLKKDKLNKHAENSVFLKMMMDDINKKG
jgi:hypothetical protein